MVEVILYNDDRGEWIASTYELTPAEAAELLNGAREPAVITEKSGKIRTKVTFDYQGSQYVYLEYSARPRAPTTGNANLAQVNMMLSEAVGAPGRAIRQYFARLEGGQPAVAAAFAIGDFGALRAAIRGPRR